MRLQSNEIVSACPAVQRVKNSFEHYTPNIFLTPLSLCTRPKVKCESKVTGKQCSLNKWMYRKQHTSRLAATAITSAGHPVHHPATKCEEVFATTKGHHLTISKGHCNKQSIACCPSAKIDSEIFPDMFPALFSAYIATSPAQGLRVI